MDGCEDCLKMKDKGGKAIVLQTDYAKVVGYCKRCAGKLAKIFVTGRNYYRLYTRDPTPTNTEAVQVKDCKCDTNRWDRKMVDGVEKVFCKVCSKMYKDYIPTGKPENG